MSFSPVAVLDSGIGGLPYLSWLQSNLTTESFVYVADNANFPYGENLERSFDRLCSTLVGPLLDRFHPKLLLVACNTASVLALDVLRSELDLPVVGVVPAVKTAAALGRGTLAVLATPRTVENDYWENLVGQFAPGRRVKAYAAPELVTLVEEGSPEPEREAQLETWSKRLKDEGVDAVVLGCTHYLHLAADLSRHLGPNVHLVDSREGVGRQVVRVLTQRGLLADRKTGASQFHFTARRDWGPDVLGPLEIRYRPWAEKFGLEYAGPWVLPVKEPIL